MRGTMFALGVLMAALLTACSPPDSVTLHKDIPSEVKKGEEFNISVTVTNDDSKAHELRSIDIGQSFLDGIFVQNIVPETASEYEMMDQHIFEFKKKIPANSRLEVVFSVKAVSDGGFSGAFDVCIDGDGSCYLNSARIMVESSG